MKEKIEAAKKTRPSKGTGNMSYGKRRNGSIRKRLGEFISLKASVNTSDSKTNDMGGTL